MRLFKMKLSVAKLTVMTAAMAIGAWGASAQVTISGTGSATYVGFSAPSVVPPSSADMSTLADEMISVYDGGGGTVPSYTVPGTSDGPMTLVINGGGGSLTDPSTMGGNVSVSGSPNSWPVPTTLSGFTGYIFLGWDGPQGADQLYFLDDVSGTVTFSNANLPTDFQEGTQTIDLQKGLSNYWLSPDMTSAPVPEASTVVAGALMLLPLGVGAVRALRKERDAVRIS